MSTQTWHQCDFPNCNRVAVWTIKRPPQPSTEMTLEWQLSQNQSYAVSFEEFCQEHSLALVTDHEQFLKDMKAAT